MTCKNAGRHQLCIIITCICTYIHTYVFSHLKRWPQQISITSFVNKVHSHQNRPSAGQFAYEAATIFCGHTVDTPPNCTAGSFNQYYVANSALLSRRWLGNKTSFKHFGYHHNCENKTQFKFTASTNAHTHTHAYREERLRRYIVCVCLYELCFCVCVWQSLNQLCTRHLKQIPKLQI